VSEPPIVRALEKDGWDVEKKPYRLLAENRTVYADLCLARHLNGHPEEIIIVEVKCFTNPMTDLQELYGAMGQYLYYRSILLFHHIDLPVYLAIPQEAYLRLTADLVIRILFYERGVNLVIVDLDREQVVQWIR